MRGQRPLAERQPPGLATRRFDPARVEPRFVRADGAHADGHGVDRGAQLVHAAAALLTGHPALAGDDHPPVEADRSLVDHERPALRHPHPPGLVLPARRGRVDDLDVDASRGEPLEPAGRFGVRIA